tara:strand:+ start:455 stop:727 length:273 start_codon:yes stop_codon:yes gene_type:complete
MNKHSKYRPLLDKVEGEIMQAEVGVTGVYRYMLEALDEAEIVETALQEELAALKAENVELASKLKRSLEASENFIRAVYKHRKQDLSHDV